MESSVGKISVEVRVFIYLANSSIDLAQPSSYRNTSSLELMILG